MAIGSMGFLTHLYVKPWAKTVALGSLGSLMTPIVSGNFTSSSEVKPTSDTSPGNTGRCLGGQPQRQETTTTRNDNDKKQQQQETTTTRNNNRKRQRQGQRQRQQPFWERPGGIRVYMLVFVSGTSSYSSLLQAKLTINFWGYTANQS